MGNLNESTRVLVALGAVIVGGIAIAASGIAAHSRRRFIAPVGTLWVNAIHDGDSTGGLASGRRRGSTGDVKSSGTSVGEHFWSFPSSLAGFSDSSNTARAPRFLACFRNRLMRINSRLARRAAGEIAQDKPEFSGWLTSLLPSNPIAAAARTR